MIYKAFLYAVRFLRRRRLLLVFGGIIVFSSEEVLGLFVSEAVRGAGVALEAAVLGGLKPKNWPGKWLEGLPQDWRLRLPTGVFSFLAELRLGGADFLGASPLRFTLALPRASFCSIITGPH